MMNMANKNIRWIILAALVLIVFSMKGTVPTESVAAVEGKLCSTDTDCPCWGTYNKTGTDISAYGIGVASCEAGTCNIDYCFDIEPVGEWARDNPWAWIRENALFTLLVAGLLIWVGFFWPKT